MSETAPSRGRSVNGKMNGADSSEHILKQLEHILDSDPLIDDVGFIHPSLFLELTKDGGGGSKDGNMGSTESDCSHSGLMFWNRDHKLGISTTILLPLYKAAKHAFMEAHREYKLQMDLYLGVNGSEYENVSTCTTSSLSILEIEAMKHSRALLLLSCDFGTAWNLRKLVVSKLQQFQFFMDELFFSSLVLSYSPKSEQAWSHRRWVIKMIAGKCLNMEDIIQRESDLVEKIAEKSKMNYRAWNHRCWLVSYMSREQLLSQSRDWACLHVADNSCFHYRALLLLKILEFSSQKQDSGVSSNTNLYELWKEELDWDEQLIRRYVGIEALWLHRRFLTYCWIKHILTRVQSKSCDSTNEEVFMENELQLCYLCSTIPDDSRFEDHQAHATYSATYIMWLTRQEAGSLGLKHQKRLEANEFKTVLNKVCPERSFLWDTLNYDHLSEEFRI